jgi:transcription antitermination factor NusG
MASYSALHSIVYYLPLKKETRVYQRRRVTFTKPVFAGYFFAALSDEGRLTLLKTNHIIRCIEIDRQEEFVHELNQVHRALDVDPGLGATASLPKGKRVRITGGPFMGIDGWVSSMKNPYKVWLHVDILGQAVSVEVDRVNLEVDE